MNISRLDLLHHNYCKGYVNSKENLEKEINLQLQTNRQATLEWLKKNGLAQYKKKSFSEHKIQVFFKWCINHLSYPFYFLTAFSFVAVLVVGVMQ